MHLQTKISIKKQSENLVDYNSVVFLLGSCFSENIGNKLNYFKFQCFQNPFGILFQPKAIELLISNAVKGKVYAESDVFIQNEQWHCFDAHSKLSATSKLDLLDVLNTQIKQANQQLLKASHIVITLGTAWVYRFIETQTLVANCHKVPQKQFQKELLSTEEVSQSLENITALIASVNATATIIFTVSPVRHLKDGFVENTQSKSHLVAAIHNVINNQSAKKSNRLAYFPSYEIMMDELRDYRFYSEDMIHPNATAINYIWNKFQEVWVSKETLKTMKEVDAIQKGLQHRPFNPKSQSHQAFLQKLEAKKHKLQAQYPHIVF